MDVVFLAVRPDVSLDHLEWIDGDDDPVVVAIIDYENPTVLEAVLDIGAMAVVGAPVRPFGVLTNLVVALKAHRESREQRQRITKLDGKLNGIRRMTKAKTILMESRGVSEEEAYKTIRDQAMARRKARCGSTRTTTTRICGRVSAGSTTRACSSWPGARSRRSSRTPIW